MGGSSLAPEVLRRAFERDRFHVLDTTHPKAIRRLAESLDLERTLFVVSSKSGGTLETRSHFDFFWERGAEATSSSITDPGSPLETAGAGTRRVRVFAGRADDRRPVLGALAVRARPRRADGDRRRAPARPRRGDAERMPRRRRQPGPRARARARRRRGRRATTRSSRSRTATASACGSSSCSPNRPARRAAGSSPRPASRPTAQTARRARSSSPTRYDLGAEFFRWEFATAVAGAILEINPFDQPNVQAAKDKTNECSPPGTSRDRSPRARSTSSSRRRGPATTSRSRRSSTRPRRSALQPFVERVRAATDCVVTFGLGPRYLHSTGQLHKGGAPIGCFLQIVDDDRGSERCCAIPRAEQFGFGRPPDRGAGRRGDLRGGCKERGRAVRSRSLRPDWLRSPEHQRSHEREH